MATESFLDKVKQLIESTYEYETSHIDAGNNVEYGVEYYPNTAELIE
jgi:hypothetical protein